MSWSIQILAEFLNTQSVTTTSITPGTGSLSATGQPVHLRPLIPPTGALAVTGQMPIVRQEIRITPGTGSLGLTGQPAGFSKHGEIVSNEYVGDGASSRSFSSANFVPLFVIVIGKDGSGNVVGAIKTQDMPTGKSQPFNQNVAASDSTRSNRITSLDTNGFTVGSDLNVTGRNYAYIMFPAGRAKTVNAGTFLGPGGKDAVNSTLSVPSGSGTISGTTCFTSTGDEASGWRRPIADNVYAAGITLISAGRRAIRNSDGVVLCEVTAAIDANSATGIGYVSGNIGGNLWHWEEYYVDVPGFGGNPDMLLYFADDSSANQIPFTVVTPAFMSGTTGSWQGTGLGFLGANFGSDPLDMRLHVNPALLSKGIRFHWIAFKANESATGVKMALFQYTSDGNARSITGLDFAPEWMFAFMGDNDFKWSKKTTNILGSSTVRQWTDGTGDSPGYGNTFNSDGFSVPAGPGQNLNNNTEAYTILLFVASPVLNEIIPGTGALAVTGQQASTRKVTTITPLTAELHLVGKQPGITPHVTFITPQTGSLIFTPRNPIRVQKRVVTPRTGALGLTGKAVRTKESKGHKITTGTAEGGVGGLQIDGKQPVIKISIVPHTGTLAATGQRVFVRPPDVPIFTKTGSLTLTGQPAPQNIVTRPQTGALTADGRAARVGLTFPTIITPDTGELGLRGQQPIQNIVARPQTGALNFSEINTEPIIRREIETTFITPITGDLSISGVSPATNPDVVVDFVLTPFTGELNLQGQEPIVQEVERTVITPATGALGLDGQPVVITPTTFITPGTGALGLDGQQPIQDFGIIPQTGQMGGVCPPCPPCIQLPTITPNTGALAFTGQPVIVQITIVPPPAPPGPPQVSERLGGVGLPHPRKMPFWPKPVSVVRGRIIEPAASFKGRGHAEENELEILLDL